MRKSVIPAARDGQYKVVEPDGKFVPQDLMKALADLFADAKSVEVVSTNPNDLAEFGLDKPKGEVTLEAGIEEARSTFFSAARTRPIPRCMRVSRASEGLPARRESAVLPALMFQWVEGKQGKNA